MANIGEPQRVWEVQPDEEPIGRPLEEPEQAPIELPEEEEVPA